MADTWSITSPLRPRARPDDLAPEHPRPLVRPANAETDEPRVASAEGDLRPRTRPEGLGTVPPETQANATTAEALQLDRLALIGLFHGPDGGSALLRLPGGSVVKVAAGGLVGGGRVTAIGEDVLRLQKDGEEIVLTMPG